MAIQPNETFIIDCGEGLFLIKLLKAFYEREAVFSAAYKFQDTFFVRIDSIDEKYVGVWFQTKQPLDGQSAKIGLSEFCNEVLDQQVRLDLDKRFGGLREIIYQHAFSPISERKGGK